MSDIAAASAEQANGIEQVNKALSQMDEVTQQNSALVEENAATAKALENQAQAMGERVAFFRTDEAAATHSSGAASVTPKPKLVAKPAAVAEKAAPAHAPKRAAAASGGPVGRMQAAIATAVKEEPAWQEF